MHMDEIKIIIWIVIGLVYLFARKKKAQPTPTARWPSEASEEYDAPEPTKPTTFDELLREIQGVKRQESTPQPTPSTEFSDRPAARREIEQEIFEDDAEVGKKQLEDTQYDYRQHDRVYDLYENAKSQAFLRPSLEETLKIDDTIVRFDQFKGYELETKRNKAAEFFKELKDPQGFRKAFILSEILKKRF